MGRGIVHTEQTLLEGGCKCKECNCELQDSCYLCKVSTDSIMFYSAEERNAEYMWEIITS